MGSGVVVRHRSLLFDYHTRYTVFGEKSEWAKAHFFVDIASRGGGTAIKNRHAAGVASCVGAAAAANGGGLWLSM